MNTQNTIYLSNGILPVSKKEGRTDACYDMNENIRQVKETSRIWFHLYEMLKTDKSIEKENRLWLSRVGGWYDGKIVRVHGSLGGDENVPKLDYKDVHKTL